MFNNYSPCSVNNIREFEIPQRGQQRERHYLFLRGGGGDDRIMEEGIWEKNCKEEGIKAKNAERRAN